MFTLENIFEKRAEFKNYCKDKMPDSAFKEIVTTKTKAEIIKAIFDNFYWVYRNVSKFGLEYDLVDDFNDGFARVRKDKKWGFVDTSFKEICELKFDFVDDFNEGYAGVQIAERYGILDGNGKEICEVKYTLDEVIKLLKELRKCSH